MRLRLTYEDERGGIDFGEVCVEVDSRHAQVWLRRDGDSPAEASRVVELDMRTDRGDWWSRLTVEVVE